jgi:hypothetical protein
VDIVAGGLIERECGIRFHPAHAWRIVRDLTRERDEGTIRRRKQKRWPDIEKSPPKKAEPLSPGMNLSGRLLDVPHVVGATVNNPPGKALHQSILLK